MRVTIMHGPSVERKQEYIESILIACKDENDGGRYGREIIGR